MLLLHSKGLASSGRDGQTGPFCSTLQYKFKIQMGERITETSAEERLNHCSLDKKPSQRTNSLLSLFYFNNWTIRDTVEANPQTGLKCLRLSQVRFGPQLETSPSAMHVRVEKTTILPIMQARPNLRADWQDTGFRLSKPADLSISHVDHLV